MKLYLNDRQRSILLEVLKASEDNALNAKDLELAKAFNDLYEKISPENLMYVNLKRGEAEAISDFCDCVRQSLDNAITFLEKDTERNKEEVEELKNRATEARDQVLEVTNQLIDKIRNNPV